MKRLSGPQKMPTGLCEADNNDMEAEEQGAS